MTEAIEQLLRGPKDDRGRHPGQRRDRAEEFEDRKADAARRLAHGYQQAEWHAHDDRCREPFKDPEAALVPTRPVGRIIDQPGPDPKRGERRWNVADHRKPCAQPVPAGRTHLPDKQHHPIGDEGAPATRREKRRRISRQSREPAARREHSLAHACSPAPSAASRSPSSNALIASSWTASAVSWTSSR